MLSRREDLRRRPNGEGWGRVAGWAHSEVTSGFSHDVAAGISIAGKRALDHVQSRRCGEPSRQAPLFSARWAPTALQ